MPGWGAIPRRPGRQEPTPFRRGGEAAAPRSRPSRVKWHSTRARTSGKMFDRVRAQNRRVRRGRRSQKTNSQTHLHNDGGPLTFVTKSFCADSVPKDQSSKGLGRRGRGVLSQACSTTLVGSLSLPAQVYRGWSTAAVARPDSPGMRSPASHIRWMRRCGMPACAHTNKWLFSFRTM